MVGAPTPPPLMYRPPSPYTSSPPPRLMGSPMSPMFGARLPFMPCPRPRWAVPPPPGVSRSPTPSGPRPFIPMPPHSPAGSPILCPSPEFYYSGISPYSDVGPPCHDYEYVGVPLEPPGPPRPPPLHIDGDEPQDGMSTADIIANQSQDYIDEKLAEYQATIQQLQDEQERVQKKTFVNWINSHLSKRVPPLRVNDLIEDLKDGTKLLALLEVLSGEKLPVERGRNLRRPHFLSNANTALQYLASKKIKLVNINSTDLVDGRPPVVLGLIWTIILYFQIEENSRALEYLGQFGSMSSLDSAGTSSSMTKDKWKQGARKTLLQWVANALPKDLGVEVKDFGPSWRDGVAFLAIIDAIKANLINIADMKKESNKVRLETAFDVAESELGIARLLDPEDVDVPKPDEKSIMTYVAQFLHKYPEPKSTGPDAVAAIQAEYNELTTWLLLKTQYLDHLQQTNSLPLNYNEYKTFKSEVDEKFIIYDKLRSLLESQSVISITIESWREIERLWTKLESQLRYWLWLLDARLPGEFGEIGKWLAEAEKLIYNDEIPTVMNEETASIISRKLEEHKAFFARLPEIVDKFQKAVNAPIPSDIPIEQINNMAARLNAIGPKATQRRIRLKFLEHKCCLIAFLQLTETKLKGWSVKYGRVDKVAQLLEQYRNFVSRNRIFQEFNKAYIDMQAVVEEYKRDGLIDQKEAASTDKFMRDTAERWKNVSMELRCVQSMLEEVVAYWRRWDSLVPEFEEWLNQAEPALQLDEDPKMEFFQDISIWKDKYQLLGDTVSFLIATCEEPIALELRTQYGLITNRWEKIFANTKQYMHAGNLIRNRKEFRLGVEKLSKWLRNAESTLASQPFGSTQKIKDHSEKLLKLQSEIEEIEELFKTISKTFQTLIQDLSRDEVDRMMNTLKKEKESLVKVRALIPMQIHLFNQLLVQQESLEAGQKEIHRWLDEAELLLGSYTLANGKDAVQSQLERHKTFFSRTLYYKSMLDSKNKVFNSIIKSVDNNAEIDTSEEQLKMKELNERFAYVSQNAHTWEQKLQEAVRCWHNFRENERLISDWLGKAESLISEKHIDSKQAVETHKIFFERVNEKWIHDLSQAAQDLKNCLPTDQQKQITKSVERLQSKWKEILSFAPLHLMRLEFRLDESAFLQYLKEIEKELNTEQQAFTKQEDVETIIERNKDFFVTKGTILQVEKCLKNLEKISTAYSQIQPEDTTLTDALNQAESQWESLAQKVESMRQTLQQIPEQWKTYHEKFTSMVKWMNLVDETLKNILNEVNTMKEFEKEKAVFQKICREADSKREDMKWLVQTLDALSSHCTEAEAIAEQQKLEALINRYKNLIPTIEVTMVKTEVYSKCYTYRKEVREVCKLLKKVKEDSNIKSQPENLEGVNQSIIQQETAVSQLDEQRVNIMSMLQRGKDLSKDTNAPKFVKEEVQSLETGWNEAYEQTVLKLKHLKETHKVWTNYTEQKDDIMSLLQKAEQELNRIAPGQHNSSNLASDLQAKQEMSIKLRKATEELLKRLRDLCGNLCSIATPEKQPLLQKEVTEIEKRLLVTLETVQERVVYLQQFNTKWTHFQSQLGELQTWAQHTGPALLQALQSEDVTPEERVIKSTKLQEQLHEKIQILDALNNEAVEILSSDDENLEAQKLKTEVVKLQKQVVALNTTAQNQSQVVVTDLEKWKQYQAELQTIKPWIEEAEVKVSMGMPKPVSLEEAVQLQIQAKEFEQQCDRQLVKLQGVAGITQQMAVKSGSRDEIDALHSRWTVVQNNAAQWANKLDKLVANWQQFDANANKLETWITESEKLIAQHSVNLNTPQVDKLEAELSKLKAFNNEISEQQAKLITLTQTSDKIGHGIALQGASAVKGRVAELKTRVTQLTEATRGRINEISDAILARQEFDHKLANFTNWMDQLRVQSGQIDQINADKVDGSLQKVHALLQEHSEKQPLFNSIYDEVKNLALHSTPEEAKILNETYTTMVNTYQKLQGNLEQKKIAFQKWSELLNWNDDANRHLQHVQYQLENQKLQPQDIEKCVLEIDEILSKVETWKSAVPVIDSVTEIQVRDKNTGKPLSAANLIRDVEVKAVNLKSQLASKSDVLQKLGSHWNHFQQIQTNITNNLDKVQSQIDNLPKPIENCEQLEEVIQTISKILSVLHESQNEKDHLHEAGTQLMNEDQDKASTIQNSITIIDEKWDAIESLLKQNKTKYAQILLSWKEFNQAKQKVEKEINRAEELSTNTEIPNDLTQATVTNEATKKALEVLKKSKIHLDKMDVKKQLIIKQAETLPEFTPKLISQADGVHKAWQNAYDKISKRAQNHESQVIIWKQIEETKNNLLPWLSDMNESLTNILNNPSEFKIGQAKYLKYKEELPSKLNLKQNIIAKGTQLKDINNGESIPNIESLIKLLNEEFADLQVIANKLESITATFEENEKDVRSEIQKTSKIINDLREAIMQCEDLSGENTAILDRLRKVKSLKNQLDNCFVIIKNIDQKVGKVVQEYPAFGETTIPKELNILQKRCEGVLTHSNKIEGVLLGFLRKFHTEKAGALQRIISTQKEKVLWCAPEPGSDRYNLEVKLYSLKDVTSLLEDCQQRYTDLDESLKLLTNVETPDVIKQLSEEKNSIHEDLESLKIAHKDTEKQLQKNIDLWQKYELSSENISSWLKDIENKLRSETINQIDIGTIDKKIKEIQDLQNQVHSHENEIQELTLLSEQIPQESDSRITQYVSHLKNRYQTVVKFISTSLERFENLNKNKDVYRQSVKNVEDWLKSAEEKVNGFSKLATVSAKPNQKTLDRLKEFVEERDKGQKLLNEAVDAGEALFAGVTPENREEIRLELRALRDASEALVDKVNSIYKEIETILLKRSSIQENHSQLQRWIVDIQQKIGTSLPLDSTLPEKKATLHHLKTLSQDVDVHKNLLKQLEDKIQSLLESDSDVISVFNKNLEECETLATTLASQTEEADKRINNHETYQKSLEKARDWLQALIAEASLVTEESQLEKDGADTKIAIVQNLLQQKEEGDKIIQTCSDQLQTVLQETNIKGHPALLKGLDDLRAEWVNFLESCNATQSNLNELCSKWNKFEKLIDELETFVKQKELQVKDQSLRNTLESKQEHLGKLRVIEDEILSKNDVFNNALVQSQSIEGDSELQTKVSHLMTRYQSLKNNSKEAIGRYELFVKEHKAFNDSYATFIEWLSTQEKNLSELSQIVGDLTVLQDRQKSIRDLIELRNKESAKFDALIDQGEKLYVHTSPDGREIIRQQLKNLRTIWESFSDDLQNGSNKLDHCLTQFAEFTTSQEQLTKWLKDVEKAMQQHTELKASLQEKRAQLQNHKLMHQEIMSHQQLVESVCDKAQQLVDQTQDKSLNVYLQSIKHLFKSIVQKSKDLLDNLNECVENHEKFNNQTKQFRDWINTESEKLVECDDITGEKTDINKRLLSIASMKENQNEGCKILNKIEETFDTVAKSTSTTGNEMLQHEIDDLKSSLKEHLHEIENVEAKQRNALQQWQEFEKELDNKTKWFRQAEAKFRDQQLQATLTEKENQLKNLKSQRDVIIDMEKDVDQFIDRSNALLHISGAERIKPLISQISNRYQLLHVLSKEVINRWQSIVDYHRAYKDKYEDANKWLTPLEEHLAALKQESQSESLDAKGNRLRVLFAEGEQGEQKISSLISSGERLYPETAAAGREVIRNELREIRERWEKLEEGIKEQQKLQDAQSLQWSSYQETLQQTIAWLDSMEKSLQYDPNSWTSNQEVKAKLFKLKALLQEVLSYKRVIETVTEKAQVLMQLTQNKSQTEDVQKTVKNINQRYNDLVQNANKTIQQLESTVDVFQQFIDLQKAHQDYQKLLWDQLANYTDYSGNKTVLENRLTKVNEILDNLPEGNVKLQFLTEHVNKNKDKVPPRAKDVMEKDLNNLKFDFEKFSNSVRDLKHNLEERLQQWIDYESSLNRLLSWLTDAESILKNYILKSTLEEKQDQLEKYQSLILSLRQNENEFDKISDESSELVQNSGDTRISVNIQQISSRFQSIQNTAKEIVKKCEQAVADHVAYNDKYRQCSEWIQTAQQRYEKSADSTKVGARQELIKRLENLRELIEQQASATSLLNNTIELGEKLYPSTSLEGREITRQQLQELQQSLESLYDSISSTERELQAKLSRWSGFEECCESIRRWLKEADSQLPQEPELKTTLDEKRAQLQIYRALLHDALAHQQDIIDLKDRAENLPERNEKIEKELASLTAQHDAILKRAQNFVERYEAIVSDHQQYSKAVLDAHEWLDATHHTVNLWGDADVERISLLTKLERLKNLQATLPEEEPRISQIRDLGLKVIPGTVESGQVNIRSQIDSSQQEWEGLLSSVQSTIESLENKLQAWNEYESLRDQCLAWIRDTDTKLHAVDLKSTCKEKEEMLDTLKTLQGEVRAKELEIDTVTERAQQLHKGVMTSRSSQISELGLKYQQVAHKVKDLTTRWNQYVSNHQEFDSSITECLQWLADIKNKLTYCSDLSATSQKDLEGKLETIQDLLLYKDEGFARVQSLVELAQNVLANTAPSGHEAINKSLEQLQSEWSSLASKMIETKSILDDSINRWSGFLEQIQGLNKTIEWMETTYDELSQFQTTMTEKRNQLERIKTVEEKVRCEKIEVDNLKSKASEMIASGQQSQAASQAQQILNKFDTMAEKIKSLLADREDQYRDHRLYKEAHDELLQWLSRAREKLPSLKQRSLSDKLAIENSVAPLDALLNKQAQGELLVEHLQHTGEVAAASTNHAGQETIRNEIRALRESFEGLFREIKQQKELLEETVIHWRDYKEEYERLSDWLQQIDIIVKNNKLALVATLEEKKKQVDEMKGILQKLETGKAQIDKFNASASKLLTSHLDTYVNNQLRHLNSRYQVQVNLAKDVLNKVETNYDQHKQYQENLEKARAWIENAKEIIRTCSESTSTSSKDELQKRLETIQNLLQKREEGQNLIHTTVNLGEKVLRNTRSDGRDKINTELKEIQNDWDRLVRKISTAKVHLETSLLQWADYSSSYDQLQQWITDREAKLQQVCEQKVVKAKKGQTGLSSLAIGERKATLRQTNSIVQDIVSFEPMIQSVTSKAEGLMQGAPATEISNKYETLSKQAKELFAKQKETVEQHQAFIDAGNEFVQWIRAAKEKLSKCSEPTGDKESLNSKISQLRILQNELPDGQKKLEQALEQGDSACQNADDEDRDIIEEEVALLQEEYDNYVESLNHTKTLLEVGIVKWTEYEDQYQEATDWLVQTEELVQSYNKLQNTLEEKRTVLEQFQIQLQTLFDWQKELDRLNMKAQVLLETCADTRISNAVTQMTTKYNALLSMAKEIMRRLELHYQEHQQHYTLYQECQDWLDRTRDKLNECQEIPNTLTEVNNKLQTVIGIRHSLEQGQNKLRYALELKEKVIMNTESVGAAKIQEDTENLKQDLEKLLNDVQEIRTKLTNRANQLEEIHKIHKQLTDWLNELEHQIQPDEQFLNDLSEKRATLEKFRAIQREFSTQTELVDKLKHKLDEDESVPRNEFEASLKKYEDLKTLLATNIQNLTTQVNEHEQYKQAYSDALDWVRKTRIEIQQCSDTHGEKQVTLEKEQKVANIIENMTQGDSLVTRTIELSIVVMKTTGSEGKDVIRQEIEQLKQDWEGLQVISKETHKSLTKCITSWNEYNEIYNKMKQWLDTYQKKIEHESSIEKKTPENLETCKQILQDVIAQKPSMEEVTDRCEALMEYSACSWVRDQTVTLQGIYTTLLTTIQGLVSLVEKNLSDHTEFLKAKKELEQWLYTAHGSVQDCIGVGDEDSTKDKLETIRLVSTRMTEGQHLLSLLNDAFTKAINTTPAEKQDSLREDMTTLRNSWDQLSIDIQSVLAQLKSTLTRWEDYNDLKTRIDKWITNVEDTLKQSHDSKGELGEMKTLQERYKHLQDEVVSKQVDLDHLLSEAAELANWAKRPAVLDDVKQLQARFDKVSARCKARKEQLDLEMQEYTLYHQSLQDTEKWLLQISFQLMAHNSLYITNREQTQEQINQHEALLDDIQKYQTTLDDVKAKGHSQIQRYVKTTPSIQSTIETQLGNVQDSYNSLLHTAIQIKNRLYESLAKFKEYEDTLESIMNNLDSYEPLCVELDVPVSSIEEANQQLEIARTLHNKLQNEKSRLAVAVQACEAATACISRPSSPQDPTPAPIPERELMVRARLEDLIDQPNSKFADSENGNQTELLLERLKTQGFLKKLSIITEKVQTRLSAITSTVQEFEEQEKQRKILQDWIHTQKTAVTEWRSKPSKLRPDAAKQEINTFNDLMSAITENKNRLTIENAATGESDTDLEDDLKQLEDFLIDTIAIKQTGQNTIERYRTLIQDTHEWFDNLAKRMEVLDKGSGLSCAQKQAQLNEIKNEFEDKGPKTLEQVKTLGNEVINIVSNLDSQQVEEQIKSIERRNNDIAKRIQRKSQVLEMTRKGIEGTRNDIEQAREWVSDRTEELKAPSTLSYESSAADEKLKKLKALLKESESKHVLQETLEKRVSNMINELESSEQSNLEVALRSLVIEQRELNNLIKSEIEKANTDGNTRKKFEIDLEKAQNWLKSKHNELQKLSGYLPLKAITVEKEIQQHKNIENETKEFNNGALNDLTKQGNALLKDCNETDGARLQSLLNSVNAEYERLKTEIEDKIQSLNGILQGRKQFESKINNVQQWLKEAEVATSSDIRTTTVELLEEQLAKYDKLKQEAESISDEIDQINEQGKAILPTISDADKLLLSEQISDLRDKHTRIANIIRDRAADLRDKIDQYREAAKKIAESVQFMAQIQNEIKDLNKPVGSKVEDVQGMLAAYEKILGELKANKAKLGDLSLDNMGELQGIVEQQDDLIRIIEDQISKLRQLLLLREQFLALITEIMTFITKYTEIVRDIEKSGHTIEEKIKRYDDVIVKIQECEAMLSSATDKGQQIAAEGTAADRNNVTEQLQSLKQSLQSLRRAVEKQRQQHELTVAEHRKLAAELEEILEWLHANEASVKSRPLLNRDIDSVNNELKNHHTLCTNVNKYLDRIKKLLESNRHEDGMPGSLLEQLSEASSLLQTLPREMEEREKYLENNKQLRVDYFVLVEKLKSWVREAEIRLETGKDGVDFLNIVSDLEEHKIFFSSENAMKELVSQKLQQAADTIWPSLTASEQEELGAEHQAHNQLLKNTLNLAKSRRAQLEQDAEIWKDYCQILDKVRHAIALSQFTDEPVTTLAGLHFNIQKISHALNDIQNQQLDVDLLNERASEIMKQADSSNRERIQRETADVTSEWTTLISSLEARRDVLSSLASRWEEFEALWQAFESALISCEEKSKHVDTVVRSQPHIIEAHNTLKTLLAETESLKPQYDEVVALSGTILVFLRECSESSATTLSAKLQQLQDQYTRLLDTLKEKINTTNSEVDYIDSTLKNIDNFEQQLTNLNKEIVEFYVFSEYLDNTEKELTNIQEKVNTFVDRVKTLIGQIRERYISQQQLIPSDVNQKLTALELLAETIATTMEEKAREFKRARTVRTEYLQDVENVQKWMQSAELKIQDRSIEPHQLKDHLKQIQSEFSTVSDQLEKLIKNGKVIIEKSRDEEEKVLIQSTINNLNEQLQQVKQWLDDKKQQVNDALDSWQRFITLYNNVMVWVKEKRTFLVEPLQLSTLSETKKKLQEYSAAVKTTKNISKNLSDMGKELESIGKITAVGDLPSKLEEAEEAKTEVEAQLLERNALLQETSEEWEQCERKMKEVKTWIEKSNATLESPQNKKKPLRDQLAIREKMRADASIQQRKISISVEKLQVHFKSGIGGDTKITDEANALINELEGVHTEINKEIKNLEECLEQLEQYQHEIQQLQQQVVQVEQQLRTTMAPTYAPHDPEKAQQDQQTCRERLRTLQTKIAARNERMKLVVQRGTPDSEPFET
ncbi:nesprin-1 [Chrysoperla carnea]|uniref:nesprin-1 n=1 Tax=Chrysoperla carnea TaxID=189513 RepID=UPI001D08EDD9|nr:nesprin-1 [Chrysoperla carnea]